MKKMWTVVVVVAAGAVAQDELTRGIEWRTDLDAARAEARRTGKPLLAVFR